MGFGTAKNAPSISSAGVSSMPSGRNGTASAGFSAPGSEYSAIPTRGGGSGGGSLGWFIGTALFAGLFGYWFVVGTNARLEAAVTRTWARSSRVQLVARSAAQSSGNTRRTVVRNSRPTLLTAWKTAATKTPGAESLAATSAPEPLMTLLEDKLVKKPEAVVPALMNAATRREADVFPFLPALASDAKQFDLVKWGLLGGAVLCAGIGGIGMIPKRRAAFAPPAPVPSGAGRAAPTAPVIEAGASAPRPTIRPTLNAATPFPPPPESGAPTITPPMRGSIAANVAAVGSASAEVTRLVKRLEELESLSGQLKNERDESRKELTWTQSALDDFKKRVSDATTMATASAAQAAGASEQRAAQAEQRVTEAVEHINEALARAVETEQGVSRAKEIAQTAEERAAQAEQRAHETQFQLARAMERLADLERLAAVTRIGGIGGPTGTSGIPAAPAALPSPDRAVYPNGFEQSSLDDALAAAAKPAPRPDTDIATVTSVAATPEPVAPDMEAASAARVPQRTPTPRLTNTKMADIEAGLKLARSIRSRTQKTLPPEQ